MNVRRYSDLTEYPKLFKKTYWGCFKIMKDTKIDDIVINRNKFVDEFKIEKCFDAPKPKTTGSIELSEFFDHCELYKYVNGFVYIISPYGGHDKYDRLARKMEFTLYKKLYLPGAVTYFRSFANKSELNMALQQWERNS